MAQGDLRHQDCFLLLSHFFFPFFTPPESLQLGVAGGETAGGVDNFGCACFK